MPPCASACHVPDARSWRSEIPRAPEPPPKLPPTTLRESASDRDVTSASARSVGRSSPCRPAPQAASSSSSSVLHPLQGAGSTLPTTARLRHAALPKGHDAVARAIYEAVCEGATKLRYVVGFDAEVVAAARDRMTAGEWAALDRESGG